MIYVEAGSMDPYFNFALEYYLINEKNLPADRVFLFWRTEPTLMIGRYQNTLEEINYPYARRQGIHIVRRITGGGTIYTDPGGWQFSFITKGAREQICFEDYLRPVIEALVRIGANAEFNSRNDLTIAGRKISGNAQCMKNGYTLHHGSLLYQTDREQMLLCLKADAEKIRSHSVKSVRERTTNIAEHLERPLPPKEFKERMIRHVMGESDRRYQLTEEDRQRVEEIADRIFRTWDWNFGKSPRFNLTRSRRFAGGKVEFKLEVNQGIIERCAVYGDFFGSTEVGELFAVLRGCPYRREEIAARLRQAGAGTAIYHVTLDELADCLAD